MKEFFSQKKYLVLIKDCKEIILLYKKNQEGHIKFLNILTLFDISENDGNCAEILIQSGCKSFLSILMLCILEFCLQLFNQCQK